VDLFEYQGKQFFGSFGIPVSAGDVVETVEDAVAVAERLNYFPVVVKAQVQVGGRGKAGGVKLAKSSAEAREHAEKILGMKLVTPQTGAEGKIVRKVYVEAGCNIAKEYYLSILVDRAGRCVSIIASTEGGMEIEEVAHNTPDKILTVRIDPKVGLQGFQAAKLAIDLAIPVEARKNFVEVVKGLYKAFMGSDLAMLEINPLVLTKDNTFVLLDAKVALEDNAAFRQKAIHEMMDYDEMDPRDLRAQKYGLNYVGLDGNIGCLVNGAGLAMATMDIIKEFGGEPANFLDVGGGATKENVTEAFRILLSDSKVKGILINIFGGIMKCDVIATGVIEAAKEVGLKVPLVVRLQGTNVDIGRKLLADSGLAITPADTMDDAAQKIVALAK
jgi:succinyl-CoA synthetase beta subunit